MRRAQRGRGTHSPAPPASATATYPRASEAVPGSSAARWRSSCRREARERRLGWAAGRAATLWTPRSPDDAIDHGGLVGQDELGAVQEAGTLGLTHTLSLVVQVGALGAVAAVHGHGAGVALDLAVGQRQARAVTGLAVVAECLVACARGACGGPGVRPGAGVWWVAPAPPAHTHCSCPRGSSSPGAGRPVRRTRGRSRPGRRRCAGRSPRSCRPGTHTSVGRQGPWVPTQDPERAPCATPPPPLPTGPPTL